MVEYVNHFERAGDLLFAGISDDGVYVFRGYELGRGAELPRARIHPRRRNLKTLFCPDQAAWL